MIETESIRLETETAKKAIEVSDCFSREYSFIDTHMSMLADQIEEHADDPEAIEILEASRAKLVARAKKALTMLNAIEQLLHDDTPRAKVYHLPVRRKGIQEAP